MTYIDPRAKIFWHLDRLHQVRTTGTTTAPVNVEIDLSNRCSLGCAWCHFAYTHTRGPLAGKVERPEGAISGGDLMDYTLAQRVIAGSAQMGVKSVTYTGGGEPTLHPQFDGIIRDTAAWGLEIGLYTHGGHIDDRRAANLKKHCTWVYVSLDECDDQSYWESKGVRKFNSACAGIQRLVEAEGKATIGVGFLLHPKNYYRVKEMVALGKQLGADYVQFRPTIHYRQDAPNQLAEDTGWITDALIYLSEYANEPGVIVDLERFRMYRDWTGHGYSTCHWSAFQTVITPNGKVWRCLNKREHADALLGDLSVESFADVWARAGGACAVDGQCRVMCRGHVPNLTLDSIMAEPAHSNFI